MLKGILLFTLIYIASPLLCWSKTNDPIIIGNLLVNEHDTTGIKEVCYFYDLTLDKDAKYFITSANSSISYNITNNNIASIIVKTTQSLSSIKNTLSLLGFNQQSSDDSSKLIFHQGTHLTKTLVICIVTKSSPRIITFEKVNTRTDTNLGFIKREPLRFHKRQEQLPSAGANDPYNMTPTTIGIEVNDL